MLPLSHSYPYYLHTHTHNKTPKLFTCETMMAMRGTQRGHWNRPHGVNKGSSVQLTVVNRFGLRPGRYNKVHTGASAPKTTSQELSTEYTKDMQEKMGDTILTYDHSAGMNYAHILDDLIIGSCLQTPADADRLRAAGVTTVLCLQQDSDLEYFDLDIGAVRRRCEEIGIRHVRCPIRDFDGSDLRKCLPKVVAMLEQQHDPEEGIAYVHCTAGMGRAPAVALAYMVWCREYSLQGANYRLQKVRPCGPKIYAIREATCDILFGSFAADITLAVNGDPASSVEIAGLDIGWQSPAPLTFDKEQKKFTITRPLLPGRYMFKLVVNGKWTCSKDYPVQRDGEIENNCLMVPPSAVDPYVHSALNRLQSEHGPMNLDERWRVLAAVKKLQPCSEECLFE